MKRTFIQTFIFTFLISICIYLYMNHKYKSNFEDKDTNYLQTKIDSLKLKQNIYSQDIDSLRELNKSYQRKDSLLRIKILLQQKENEKYYKEISKQKTEVDILKSEVNQLKDSLSEHKQDPLKIIIQTKQKLKRIEL